MSLPVDSILSVFCTFMFPILNTISLSRHEQVCWKMLVHDVINLLYYEQTSTNIFKYVLSFFKTTTILTQLLRSFQGYFIDSELCLYSMLLNFLHYYLILILHLWLLLWFYYKRYKFDKLLWQGVFHLTFILWYCTIHSILVSLL